MGNRAQRTSTSLSSPTSPRATQLIQHQSPTKTKNLLYTSTSPSKNYAQRVQQHLPLKLQTQNSLKNLKNILSKQSKLKLVQPANQIYYIKSQDATYEGSFSKGFPTGYGIVHFRDGCYFQGNFHEGDASGYGVYIYGNGSVYEGDFKDSTFYGNGILTYKEEKMKYEGQFAKGVPEGKGKEVYFDASYYEGDFRKGEKQGKGVYQWPDGRRYQGSFAEGLMHGKGILTRGSQIIFQGEFSNGLKSGYGVLRTTEGIYEGVFENDVLNGNGTFAWKDGKVYEGGFYNSLMHGRGKLYYPSNQVAEGEWEHNHNKQLLKIGNDPSVSKKIMEIQARHNGSILPSNTHISKYKSSQNLIQSENSGSGISSSSGQNSSSNQYDSVYTSGFQRNSRGEISRTNSNTSYSNLPSDRRVRVSRKV